MSTSESASTQAGSALSALFAELLGRIREDLPGSLGAAITVRRHDGPLTVLATDGIAEYLVPAQAQLFGGPVPAAADLDEPVVTDHVLTDPRWPELTLDNLSAYAPHLAGQWVLVAGIAALPTPWDDTGTVVLSAALDHPASQTTLATLGRYEKLVATTLIVAEAATGGATDQMIALLQSRAAIEEAKGAIIAIRGCSPDEAWATLRRASQEFNVKLRELAAALIEYLGHAPAPHPDDVPPIVPTSAARGAAATLWVALTTPTEPPDPAVAGS